MLSFPTPFVEKAAFFPMYVFGIFVKQKKGARPSMLTG
jgi:hypothetical protein